MYPDKTPALQFVRVESLDGSSNYTKLRLTNDSINLVLLSEEFGLSLNQSISEEVARNIIGNMPRARRSIADLEAVATKLVRGIIEYQVVVAQARAKL